MLVGDWTGQLAGERVAELHRQAERQRLVRLSPGRNVVAATAAGVVAGACWRAH